jgi:hypothetical protein
MDTGEEALSPDSRKPHRIRETKRLGCAGVLPDDRDILRRRDAVPGHPFIIGFPTSSRTRPLASGLRDNSLLPPCG